MTFLLYGNVYQNYKTFFPVPSGTCLIRRLWPTEENHRQGRGETGQALADVKIENSALATTTAVGGEYVLDYAPGEFRVIFA